MVVKGQQVKGHATSGTQREGATRLPVNFHIRTCGVEAAIKPHFAPMQQSGTSYTPRIIITYRLTVSSDLLRK